MNKILTITAILMTAMFASSVLADSLSASATVYCTLPSDCTQTILNLCAKDSTTPTWQCIPGATGTLTFGTEGQKFTGTLTTSGLQDKDYALIYYKDQADRFNSWNGADGVVIKTFHDNQINLAIDNDIGSLPKAGDWNIAPDKDYCAGHNGFDYYAHCTGAKIWIVPTSDLTSGSVLPLTVWNPTTYLFETDLVTYTKRNPTTTCVGGQCVPITCGISLSGSPAFGNMVQGTTYQSPQATTVTNTGNVPENPTISGDYWYGSQWIAKGDGYWMPIGATQWYVSGWNTLSSTPTSIGTISSPLGTATVWYQLTVPSPQPTDTYSQTITFGVSC
jgi:hypothetical protein